MYEEHVLASTSELLLKTYLRHGQTDNGAIYWKASSLYPVSNFMWAPSGNQLCSCGLPRLSPSGADVSNETWFPYGPQMGIIRAIPGLAQMGPTLYLAQMQPRYTDGAHLGFKWAHVGPCRAHGAQLQPIWGPDILLAGAID